MANLNKDVKIFVSEKFKGKFTHIITEIPTVRECTIREYTWDEMKTPK